MNVSELNALLADKSDACEVQVVIQEMHLVGGALSYTTGFVFNEPVVEQKADEAADAAPEAENATELTTDAVADAPVSA